MTFQRFRTSAPDEWINPRPYADPSLMLYRHGPIRPMKEPSFIARFLNLVTDKMRRA